MNPDAELTASIILITTIVAGLTVAVIVIARLIRHDRKATRQMNTRPAEGAVWHRRQDSSDGGASATPYLAADSSPEPGRKGHGWWDWSGGDSDGFGGGADGGSSAGGAD